LSTKFYVTVIFLLVAFGSYMTWLNDRHEKIYDELLAGCTKPASVPEIRAEFYFPPGPVRDTPIVWQ
jgi:hypothetical protein